MRRRKRSPLSPTVCSRLHSLSVMCRERIETVFQLESADLGAPTFMLLTCPVKRNYFVVIPLSVWLQMSWHMLMMLTKCWLGAMRGGITNPASSATTGTYRIRSAHYSAHVDQSLCGQVLASIRVVVRRVIRRENYSCFCVSHACKLSRL